jgi:hypothetical protein
MRNNPPTNPKPQSHSLFSSLRAWIRKIPVHPFLFAIYPVLALLAHNMDQLRPETTYRSIAISLAGGALLYFVFIQILRKKTYRPAALLTSLWLLLFWSYGQIYELIEGHSIFGWVYGKHRYLAIVWALLLAVGTFLIVKKLKHTKTLTTVLNIAGLVLIIFPTAQIAWFEIRFTQLSARRQNEPVSQTQTAQSSASTANLTSSPDIYYILLDGYSRSDVIQKLYGLDITPTLDQLKSLGFVIPNCAQSNYGITALSMFGTLNMNYLDSPEYQGDFPIGSDASEVDYQAMRDYLRHSQVRSFLEARGYQMITFETGYWWLDIDDTGNYIVENNNPLKKYSSVYALSNFEDMLIRSTALRLVTEANAAYLSPLTRTVKTPTEQHYEWVKFALDQLGQVPQMPGKKFVYFHVLAPHDPFVFAPDGTYLYSPNSNDDQGSDVPGYPNSIQYLNNHIVEIVKQIKASSKTDPIIIIQGDHGWDPRYRSQILNAYYLPDGGSADIYPTITPVNTFRIIFNRYFGANYPLLPDQSYFSMGSDFPIYGIQSRPYQLTPVPNTCVGDIK